MSSLHRRPGFLLALGLCVIGGAVTLLGRLAVGPQTAPTRVQLTNVAGTEACPSFSANGRHLAYSGKSADSGSPFHIWVRALPTGAPQQLTGAAGNDVCPVWSPDGVSLAFLRVTDDGAQYVTISSAGGTERKITDADVPTEGPLIRSTVAWMHDGKSLAVVQTEEGHPPAIFELTLANGTWHRITNPPANSSGDSNPAASPDGQTLAFVRGGEAQSGDIWLCDRNGGSLRQLTFDASATRGVAWTPDGHDIVYASNRVGRNWRLWRIPAFGGSPREVVIGASVANDPAIAPAGNRMAYTQTPSMSAIWLANLPAGPDPHTRPIIRSAGREAAPSWSPDGKQIAWVSDRSGGDQIWVCDASGGNEAQVTDMKGMSLTRPLWFNDGRAIVFTSRGMQQSVFTVPASARTVMAKALSISPGQRFGWVSVSHDGKSQYAERDAALWKFTSGKEPLRLTEQIGAGMPEESPDGKFLYYWWRRSFWRIPAAGGTGEEVFAPDQWIVSYKPTAAGIYFMGFERRRRMAIWFYDFASQKITQVLAMADFEMGRDASFDVSPDGKYLLYPKIDRAQTDLCVVENFR